MLETKLDENAPHSVLGSSVRFSALRELLEVLRSIRSTHFKIENEENRQIWVDR